MSQRKNKKVYYHLPGLFEFYELYCAFLPLYKEHREYFYDWCEISSIYGSPADCLWGGGRAGFGSDNPEEVLKLTQEYGISARLTFSNSLLRKEHLTDKKCNILCKMFEEVGEKRNGVIVHSDLLLKYLEINYPKLYFVSSTTKVLTDFNEFLQEVKKEDFRYVVPDFRLNKAFDKLFKLLLKNDGSVYYHCSAGKDRTGIATFLVMMALDMNEEDAINEYLLSNKYLKNFIDQFYLEHNVSKEFQKLADKLLYVREENILLAINAIKCKYQSYDDYFEKEYNLTKEKRKLLKAIYCE